MGGKEMIFATENAIPDILAERKTQTRRLVKEDDWYHWEAKNDLDTAGSTDFIKGKKLIGIGKIGSLKWRIGWDYAVQTGRGKKGLEHCPRCKIFVWYEKGRYRASDGNDWSVGYYTEKNEKMCKNCLTRIVPLRIKLTGIRKERLLDISEEDAKKEVSRTKRDYLKKFYELYVNYSFNTEFEKGTIDYESALKKVKEIRKKARESLEMLSLAIVPDDPMFYWNPEIWVLDFEVKKNA